MSEYTALALVPSPPRSASTFATLSLCHPGGNGKVHWIDVEKTMRFEAIAFVRNSRGGDTCPNVLLHYRADGRVSADDAVVLTAASPRSERANKVGSGVAYFSAGSADSAQGVLGKPAGCVERGTLQTA